MKMKCGMTFQNFKKFPKISFTRLRVPQRRKKKTQKQQFVGKIGIGALESRRRFPASQCALTPVPAAVLRWE